jgi:hypothetical protein
MERKSLACTLTKGEEVISARPNMVAVHFISASITPDQRSPTKMASAAAKGTVPPLFRCLCGMNTSSQRLRRAREPSSSYWLVVNS